MAEDFISDLLGSFFRDLMGGPVPDMGSEFSVSKAEDAYALMHSFASDARALPVMNEAGMFPRIKVTEHRDLDLLRVLVANHAAELKEQLLTMAGRYALGSGHVDLNDLQNTGSEYVHAATLAQALQKEHETMLAREQEILASKLRANTAFADMAAQRDREAKARESETHEMLVSETHEMLVSVARASDTIRQDMADGNKISAIKELRNLTLCGLREAKKAVEAAF